MTGYTRRTSNNQLRHNTRKALHLDKEDGWIFGVCAGMANFLKVDHAVVRVGWVIAGLFATKIVVAVYLIAWLLLDD